MLAEAEHVFAPTDLALVRGDLAAGKVINLPPLAMTRTVQWGRAVVFCTRDVADPILRNHQSGQFFEAKDVRALRPHFPKGGVFVDIGANVGNHSLFAALYLGASLVVLLVRNRLSHMLLLANFLANGLVDMFDLRRHGGAPRTGRRTAPEMLVALDTRNDDAFLAWVASHKYTVAHVFIRYKANKNYLITAAAQG